MVIKIKQSCGGLTFSYKEGDIVEVNPELGNDLINGKLAEKIDTATKPKQKAGAKANAETE